jgi:hypothetical protein
VLVAEDDVGVAMEPDGINRRPPDAVFVKGFLGHSKLATTERHMHAKARPEDVERLNQAFGVRSNRGANQTN